MLKWRWLALCCVSALTALGISTDSLSAADSLYQQAIRPPAKMQADLKSAVEDLQTYLQRITGQPFALAEDDQPAGILLRRADAEGVPAAAIKQLPGESREAVCLWPDGDDRLWLISRSDTGLSHAVYLYLEQLGCRWYFPTEAWTIVPKLDDIRLNQPVAVAPAFRSRLFAGTGGFGGKLPIDPERKLEQSWYTWQRRNRFGGEFRVSGHTGEAFNLVYRKELEAHPEWRAMIDGQRVPWSITAKFCPGNPEVVDLYVQDRLKFYRQAQERNPEDPRAWAVSVEPADGGQHCTAPESLALGTVSDRVFHVANQVAKAVRQEFPAGHVSLFAYNEHAAVPNIPLEPNVYVQVIPYAFQRTGLTPDQLLDAWSQKVSRMGIYDYWSIPDWSHDLPTFDPLGFGPQRLRGWHRRGVDSFLCESTYSSGAMGPAWYIAAQLAWQPDKDEQAIFAEFLQDCFGPAAGPMREMLLRWSGGFYLTSHELALSFRNVAQAWELAGQDPSVAARVADYGRYVEYLRRGFEYLQTKRGSEQRRAAAERLMRFSWGIYESTMIHAFRHSQLLARDEKLAGNPTLITDFDWQNHDAPAWAKVTPLGDDEIRARVHDGAMQFQPQAFATRTFDGPLVPLAAVRPAIAEEEEPPVLWLNNTLEFNVLAQQANEKFTAKVATELPVGFLVTDPDGKSLTNTTLVTGPNWRTEWSALEVTLPKPGLYKMQIVSQKRMFRFAPSPSAMLSTPGWSNSQGTPTPRLYFYVPQQTETLAIYANYTAAGPPRFFNPQGEEITPTLVDQGHLQLLEIPPDQRGRIWSLDRAKCPLGPMQMLNAPQSFSLLPSALLVPQDVASGK